MALSAKLAACEVEAPSTPSIPVREILEPAKIVAARRVPTRFNRPAILLEVVLAGGESRVTFLPTRFDRILTDEDLKEITNSRQWSVKCTGTVARAVNVMLFKH